MNTNFTSVEKNVSEQKAKTLMRLYKINQIPVLDKNKNIINVYFSNTIETKVQYENPVIIMAGGLEKD